NIGNIHYYQDNLTEAIEYYKRSAKLRESIGDRQGMSGSYSNIGGICFKQKKYDEALEYFKKSISINEELGDKRGLSKGYNNIGLVYKIQGKYSLALEHYQKSLAIKEAFGDKSGIALVRGCITSLYLVQADSSKNTDEKTDLYKMAVKNAENSLEIVKEIGALPHENSIYKDLSHAWSGLKNYKNAFEYSQKFITTKDSLFNNEKTKIIEEMETKYQTEKKEKENELLKKDNEIKILALDRQTTLRNFFIALSAFVTLLVVFTFYRFRMKKKANKILSEKNELITKQKEEQSVILIQLNELNATKDKFFSIIGHDLQTPFQAIIGFSELLKNERNEFYTDKMRSMVNHIYNVGKSTSNLLSNLLDWSRSQTGMIEFKPERFHLKNIFEREIDILSITSKKKEINISIDVPDGMTVFADKNMIGTVIRNLVYNAIKFTYENGNIQITGRQTGEYIETAVSDTGVGIDPKNINRIFNIDFKLSTTGTHNEKGTGLGLVLCREFIERNNGKIRVESALGKGSSFIFTLPIGDDAVKRSDNEDYGT
ncbi:MAG: tetratricopeptide repeat-containing sensor histidine kinase, partial [Candidatus Delongbacteria bacterium]|nr:tetratricopeptide repeat-containing sensor histidine kinase [Candidatus Delongbacteria bacterium]